MSIPDPIVLLDARAKYVHPAFRLTRASTKTVFDATGKLVTVPANALGWDHDPATGQARGYLAEQSATNLLLHSNDLTQAAWTVFGSSITPSAITGPDGSGMDKLVEDSSGGLHRLYQTFTIADGATVALSVILRASERDTIYAYIMNASASTNNARCIVNLTDGTVSGGASSGSGVFIDAKVIPLGSGFYKLTLVGTLGSGVTNARVEFRLADGNGEAAYTGDGTSGLYIGVVQAEVGSCPTSYIETGAATATRAPDSLILSGVGNFPWWRSERGTLLVEADVPPSPFNMASQGQFWMFGGSSQFRLTAFPAGGMHLRSSHFSNLVVSSDISDSYNKVAVTWAVDDEVAVSHNGGAVGASDWTGGVVFSDFGIGTNPGTSSQQLTFPVLRVVYYPQRISNADLQSLTAIQE